ncbi:helix-turn-helix domain-containing protein [Catellatospora vulcania]|uniref:helix-turn-helix domain-containing protein n=1 Tax=Catellatospora vulcania TaxID=1460450 RepID=UPI0012D48F86|nr:helix-turn-helix transcriptional regulator [Catellatospora vulcania]
MFPDVDADRLLSAARRTADPAAAARLIAEAFFHVSRTADPATLSPLVDRLAALRSDPARPQTEALFHTVAGAVGVRTRKPHATRHLESALRIVETHRLDADPLHLECAMLCTLTLMRPQETRPRFAHLVAQADVTPARRARLVSMLGLGDAWSGDLLRGRAGLHEARRLAQAAGRLDIEAEATSWLVKIEAMCGDLAASAACLTQARDLAARSGSRWVAAHIAECAAALHLASGDTDAWLGVLEFLVGTVVGANSGLIFEHRWELATHYALHGRADAAAALLAAMPDPPLGWPGAPALPAWRGWIAQPADPAAMARFEASLAGLNRPVERLSRPRMAWLLGAQHARLGRRADATRLLEVACTGYAAIGAAGLLAQVMTDLQRLGLPGGPAVAFPATAVPAPDGPRLAVPVHRPDGPSLAEPGGKHAARPDGQRLTEAETRVAQAVAGGRSNREVAALLGVSAKTVEFHLGNIFRKLGVRNRTELAATTSTLQLGA